tara:strand:- start:149 stop:1033 length:885 start_codon:yes stop_codon:yes gene_type:complete
MSKWQDYEQQIIELLEQQNNTKIAETLLINGTYKEIEAFRRHIANVRGVSLLKGKIKPAKKNVVKIKSKQVEPYLNGDPDNVLIIGDLHEPFSIDEYLEFCRQQQELYNCGTVIFIGDVIDNHYSSYHESDPDGYGAGEELDRAIVRLQRYYHTFPVAKVIIGNHDRLVYRKAFSGGVAKRWIREYKDVLNTPNWDFVENIEIFDVNINHGEGGTASNRIKSELQSQIQGHLHSQLYVQYLVGANFIVFGMQVGCGVNNKAYALAYGKNYKKPAIGCGVLINKGTLPIAIPMKM